MRYGGERFYLAFAVIAYNGSRCLRTLLQREEAYLVSISKTGFSPLMARTPTPWSILYEPSLMMRSSKTQDS
ncbi:Uncharacterised protein [Salmonella enterica subsp. enterica]|uniref:Uncharacterized protein n=1 Tax=Salmonella enterica I TaxID=59201 RepID=A0A379WKG0_SALET|nr:Uncharacterised protein [Salmonella enterica subsp. enterica]